ncbi:hypothetical protein [Romboutsia timonensis]|uniref:hypothetical protein n=1 Tax=Romboutsia timonensis TaxID=1776391 RepID=UPI002A7FFF1A|nr:hypothetical protein [Romboutsia timonensis]MDY3960182.1 hypothetical protein [Romboutsia timonensis]
MNRKLEDLLIYIKINKKSKCINITLNIDEFNELEKNRTEFCHEVGKILGSCNIEVEKIGKRLRLLKIEKVEDDITYEKM